MGKLKGSDKMTEQAYRYPKGTWTADEARKHCKKHSGILFEPASGKAQTFYNKPLLLYANAICDIDLSCINFEADSVLSVQRNVGFIDIKGVIGKQKINSYSDIFNAYLADNSIDTIVLNIDSPGGFVDGVMPFANQIFEARAKKNIISYVNSMAASAAYWIASAANKVILESPTAQVGSIGVIILHVDISGAEEKLGIKITEITAGDYKGETSPHKPLSDTGHNILQEQAEHIYSLFLADVIRFRGSAVKQYANGKVFLGDKAVNSYLADDIMSLEGIVMPEPEPILSVETLKSDHPQLYAEIDKMAYDRGYQEAYEKGLKDGIEKERIRMNAIAEIEKKKLYAHGYEHIFAEARNSGQTPEELAYRLVQAADERGVNFSAIEEDAPPAVGNLEMSDDDKILAEITSGIDQKKKKARDEWMRRI